MRTVLARLAASVLALAACWLMLVPASPAGASEMCGQYDTQPVAANPEYVISNDAWGYDSASYSGQQCITPSGDGFTVTASAGDWSTVHGYPHMSRGCDNTLASCTPASGLPVRVSQLGGLHSSWSTSATSAPGVPCASGGGEQPWCGEWDVAYDLFAGNADYPQAMTDRTEVMVWLKSQNIPLPACTKVYLEGTYWCMWHRASPYWTGTIVTFRRLSAVTSVTNLSLRPFISYTVTKGWTKQSWHLASVQAGFELYNGGTGLATNSFSVTPW